jgi:predicted RNA-binding protein with PUA-like domain
MQYWLMKSEPDTFSIDDLIHAPLQSTGWDGVRNYQARNYMRTMQIDDQVFFYHSNCKTPGIIGIAKVIKLAYPDDTAWNPDDIHYDSKSLPSNSRWDRVDIKFVRKFSQIIPLKELYHHTELKDLPLVKKGNRLSIMPVSATQWAYILEQILPTL